jgi:hypothetical protein
MTYAMAGGLTMTLERMALISTVWSWDTVAIKRNDPARRSECWKILDALYADCPRYRSEAFLKQVDDILARMRQTADVVKIRTMIRTNELAA